MRSDRFNEFEEIARVLKHPHNGKWNSCGPILYYRNDIPYYLEELFHNLIIGLTGAGKSHFGTKNIVGAAIVSGESFIVTDPKGEIEKETSPLLPDEYLKIVLDFRNITTSAAFNPLAYAYTLWKTHEAKKQQQAHQLIEDLAAGLYPLSGKEDPFWKTMARTLFISVVLLLFKYATSEEEVTIYNVYNIITKGEEKNMGSTYLKELVELEPESITKMNLQGYINTASDTKAGIRSVTLDGLVPFIRSDALASMLCNDDINMEMIDGEKPVGIYVIMPDETDIFSTVVGSFISQISKHFITLAESKYNGTLPRRINIVIDELASVGKSINNLDHMMSAARSRNIRITAVLQNYAQLNALYGDNKADTIISNFGVVIAFATNNWDTLQELSKRCGERTTKSGQVEPLITPSQLAALDVSQALVLIKGRYKYITYLPGFHELFRNAERYSKNTNACIERKPIKVFDIKTCVEQKKKGKILGDSDARKSVPSFFNPFESLESTSDSNNSEKIPEVDVEELLKTIDAKIAALEEEERLEKEKNSKHDECMVSIMNKGNNLPALVSLVAKTLEITLREAKSVCEELPFDIKISSREKANEFLKRAEKLGVIAIIKSNNN